MRCGFVGRERELSTLQRLVDKQATSLVVVTGRRRIGKSRLVQEFGERNPEYRYLSIAALAPQPGIAAANQREAFADQMAEGVGIPPVTHDDWLDLFTHLAKATERDRWIVLLDEISWMGKDDPEFLPKLKIAWDKHFNRSANLILVLCGSVSSWLEKNILAGTGFVGRVSLHLRIEGLPMPDCDHFWGKARKRTSFYDKLKILAVTGGVPRYLEEVVVRQSAEENIRHLCFSPEGLLFREFDQIFSDLFDKRSAIYRRIVESLAEGHGTLNEICRRLGIEKGGAISAYLEDLVLAGFLKRDYTWDLKTRNHSNLSRFRLQDNYVRFYTRYIQPNRVKIEDHRLDAGPLSALPGWESIVGLQFENLVLANRGFIWRQCGLSPAEVELDGPYFQRPTRRHRGCQIDYLIQARHGPVYLCEIKFSRSPVSTVTEHEVREKIERLAVPRHCSVLPVLIHANEVSEAVKYGDTFARIVDFADILRGPGS